MSLTATMAATPPDDDEPAAQEERPVRLSEPPLRVGFVMSTEVGLRTQYLNWRDCLPPEAGVDPTWAVIDWEREGGLVERLPLLPAALKSRIRAQLELREGLGRAELDALFVAIPAVFYGNERWLRRQPYAITIDSTPEQLWSFGELYGRRPSRLPFAESLKWRARLHQYREAAVLFPWSRWAAASLVDGYGVDPARIQVMPPGIDLDRWTFPERPSAEEAGEPVRVLFVGGDFLRKGGDLLLEWAERTGLDDWELHIVTRDAVSTHSSRVHVHHGLTPNSPALRRLYAQASVFALPTRGDCYSLASMEAMAAGLPVILSEIGGTGDVIRDGETGFLIRPGDGPALAERLDTLVGDAGLRQRMGRAARHDTETRYDVRKNILRTVAILREAIGR
ncbi:MAG: glycosyltransferase family 4 protein [Chloroflexi bacterium]|nr:glycosyltransferase family 4 protein [Chloroflexota bacterium]